MQEPDFTQHTPRPRSSSGRSSAGAAATTSAGLDDRLRGGDEGLRARRRRAARRHVPHRQGRVRVHRRRVRLGQVDARAPAAEGARRDARQDRRRRPRPRAAQALEGADAAPEHRLRLPGLQAAAEPHARPRTSPTRSRCRARAAASIRQARCPRCSRWSASRTRRTRSPTSSPAASSSASRSRARSSTTRRSSSATSRPGNLDPDTSVGIMQLLYRINRSGTTMLMVTHDREMVDKMRKRVIQLEDGPPGARRAARRLHGRMRFRRMRLGSRRGVAEPRRQHLDDVRGDDDRARRHVPARALHRARDVDALVVEPRQARADRQGRVQDAPPAAARRRARRRTRSCEQLAGEPAGQERGTFVSKEEALERMKKRYPELDQQPAVQPAARLARDHADEGRVHRRRRREPASARARGRDGADAGSGSRAGCSRSRT